jgi:16S rRNA (cytosine967-C5)-methyltransferase
MAMNRAAGFVNALLRKASAQHTRVPFPELTTDPVAYLSTKRSFPQWLVRRWLERFDQQTAMTLCDTLNSIPPITVRTNTLKASRKQLRLALQDEVERIEPTPYAPDGVRMVNPRRPIPELTAFKKGWFQVQDEAAQLVSLLLNPLPGETVLDGCAGRGGKTAHIAQLMANQGRIAAVDKDETKLQQLDTEMQRLGVSIVQPRCHDLDSAHNDDQTEGFDRILLDAPCSGLGVLRRNPDIKWNSAEAHLKRHAKMQKRLLENLAPLVKPNGILVYAVCSIEPEENEAVIDVFLKKHPEFVIDNHVGRLPEPIHSFVEPATGLKTLPILSNMDGFFITRLKRIK